MQQYLRRDCSTAIWCPVTFEQLSHSEYIGILAITGYRNSLGIGGGSC